MLNFYISQSQGNWMNDLELQEILSQITAMQSLESISLIFSRLNNGEPFKVLSEGLPKLKVLGIKIIETDQPDFWFPFEDLVHIVSLEKLEIILPMINKDNILKKLPKIKSLKELSIKNNKSWSMGPYIITMEDYSRIGAFNLFAK